MQIPAALPPNNGYADIISESTQTDDSDSLNAAADLLSSTAASAGGPVELSVEEEDDSSETSSVMERLSRRVREGMGLWDERQDRATQVGCFLSQKYLFLSSANFTKKLTRKWEENAGRGFFLRYAVLWNSISV